MVPRDDGSTDLQYSGQADTVELWVHVLTIFNIPSYQVEAMKLLAHVKAFIGLTQGRLTFLPLAYLAGQCRAEVSMAMPIRKGGSHTRIQVAQAGH